MVSHKRTNRGTEYIRIVFSSVLFHVESFIQFHKKGGLWERQRFFPPSVTSPLGRSFSSSFLGGVGLFLRKYVWVNFGYFTGVRYSISLNLFATKYIIDM